MTMSSMLLMLTSTFMLSINFIPGTLELQAEDSLAQIKKYENECLKYSTPIEKRLALKQKVFISQSQKSDDYFNPIQFQTTNEGPTKYKLTVDKNSEFRLYIQNEGATQSILKGGELDGIYSFLKSVIRNNEVDTRALDIWNIYVRNHESQKSDTAHKVIVLKVTVQESEKMNSKLIPILNAMETLTENVTSVFLPFNYDPYAILPNETAFAIYETNKFPFPYPNNLNWTDDDTNTTLRIDSHCEPILKVYAFTHPVFISKSQLKQFHDVGKKLAKVMPSKLNVNVRSNSEENEIDDGFGLYDLGKVSYTPLVKHLLFRRTAVEPNSLEGVELSEDDEDYEDDEESNEPEEEEFIDEDDPAELAIHQKPIIPQDEELFPSDCAILYKVSADFEGRTGEPRKGHENNSSGRSVPGYAFSFSIMVLVTCLEAVFSK